MTIKKWNHSRKGLIIGEVISSSNEWTSIKLSNDVEGINTFWEAGEEITVRNSLLTEIE